MTFDIFIPCAEKDKSVLNFCLNSLKQITNFSGKVYVCSNFEVADKMPDVTYLRDENVNLYNKKFTQTRFRDGWLKQQFMKLLQGYTSNRYLVIDADTIINKPITIKHGEFIVNTDVGIDIFTRMPQKLKLKVAPDVNYISEIMLFDRKIVNEMISDLFENPENFIDWVNSSTNYEEVFSEFELYGNYFANNHSQSHSIKKIESLQFEQISFTSQEIDFIIKHNTTPDIISFHTRTVNFNS